MEAPDITFPTHPVTIKQSPDAIDTAALGGMAARTLDRPSAVAIL